MHTITTALMVSEDDLLPLKIALYSAATLLAIALYGATAYCARNSIRRLRRNLFDVIGYAWLTGALVVPVGTVAPIVGDDQRLASRASEIRSWPTAIPNPIPRNLVIHPRRTHKVDYALELAESGLFDVYVVGTNTLRKAVLSDRPDCADIRHQNVRFASMMNFRRCAVFIKVDAIPEDGLVFFEERGPLSFPETAIDPKRLSWAFQLVHHRADGEHLIAYSENIRPMTIRRAGILFYPGLESSSRQGAGGRRIHLPPDAATFIYQSLGLDPDKIQPQ